MPHAPINGIDIYYEAHGIGDTIIFCHEFAGDIRSWDLQVNYFSRSFQVITYCARGYPPTSVPEDPESYSQDLAIDDLKGLMDFLKIDNAHIVGLSMGGNVALNFGIKYPEQAKTLTVAGTGTGSDDPGLFRDRILKFSKGMRSEGMTFMSDYLKGPQRVQHQLKDPKGYQLFCEQFMEHSNIGSANTFYGVMTKRLPIFDLKNQLSNIKIPVLVMTGDEDDPCIKPSLFIKKTIPTAGLIMFPRSGHAINLEEPQLFNTSVAEFIKHSGAPYWGPRSQGEAEGSLT
ncbi:MAG: alpha/beta hydrolase [SAR202 cluster bacterium]|nr:alpha/beta hydrolase [SAR202 cluster bacterium]